VKFFKKEDFEGPAAFYRWVTPDSYEYHQILDFVCMRANEKLEREGKVVYTGSRDTTHLMCVWHDSKRETGAMNFNKALLICIEPIEECRHEKEKVMCVVVEGWDKSKSTSFCNISAYQCECGTKVVPSEFKKIE
jgi:hypothetical protein